MFIFVYVIFISKIKFKVQHMAECSYFVNIIINLFDVSHTWKQYDSYLNICYYLLCYIKVLIKTRIVYKQNLNFVARRHHSVELKYSRMKDRDRTLLLCSLLLLLPVRQVAAHGGDQVGLSGGEWFIDIIILSLLYNHVCCR